VLIRTSESYRRSIRLLRRGSARIPTGTNTGPPFQCVNGRSPLTPQTARTLIDEKEISCIDILHYSAVVLAYSSGFRGTVWSCRQASAFRRNKMPLFTVPVCAEWSPLLREANIRLQHEETAPTDNRHTANLEMHFTAFLLDPGHLSPLLQMLPPPHTHTHTHTHYCRNQSEHMHMPGLARTDKVRSCDPQRHSTFHWVSRCQHRAPL
jgi:hypothetical protein